MTVAEARKITVQLLWEHGLYDWKVVFDQAKTRAGICRYSKRQIGISVPVLNVMTYEGAKNTILHEVAHARVGRGVEHGPKWQEVFKSMGGNGQRVAEPEEFIGELVGKYKLTCPSPTCGHYVYMHRRPKVNRSCSQCAPYKYSERYKMIITETVSGKVLIPVGR